MTKNSLGVPLELLDGAERMCPNNSGSREIWTPIPLTEPQLHYVAITSETNKAKALIFDTVTFFLQNLCEVLIFRQFFGYKI